MAERIPILPQPGLVSDSTDYAAPGVWNNGSNVRFFHGVPETLGREQSLQSGAAETYRLVTKMMAYRVSGVVHVAIAGQDKLYRVNTTTWARTDITPASGWNLITDGQRHSLAMFGDVLLAVPHHRNTGTSNGTLFESVAGATAVATANAPANINCMIVTPSRQVMALGCNEEVSTTYNGRCIRWSDIGVRTTWATASNNNAGEYILPGQEDIVGARMVGDYIAIWTTGSLYMGQYIGQPGQTFIFTRIDNKGLVSKDCHAEFQGTLYWMGPDLFVYQWRPGMVPQKVECPCQIDVWRDMDIQSGVSANSRSNFHAFTNHRFGEIWFCHTAGTENPTQYVAFCVNESAAAQRPVWFQGAMSAGAVIDDPLLAGAASMGGGTAIRIEYAVDASFKILTGIDIPTAVGTVPAWNIQSSFYYMDEGKRRVQVQRYIADTHGDSNDFSLTLQLRDYPESTASTSGPHTIQTAGITKKADFRASGRLVSVKFSNGTPILPWRLGKPVFEVVALGNR